MKIATLSVDTRRVAISSTFWLDVMDNQAQHDAPSWIGGHGTEP